MKIAPVSGDLLVKLGVGVVAFGGLAMLIYTWKSEASAAAGAAANALDAINPTSADNVVYTSYNQFAGQIMPDNGPGRNADGSWTLGGFVHDILNPVTAYQVSQVTRPTGTGWW